MLKIRKIVGVLYLIFNWDLSLYAQTVLSLEEAIRLALENNYEIRISRNNLAIDRNNVTLGNAGFLPVAGADFSNNNNLEDTRQNRSDGTIREGNGVRSSGTNYGIGINWTIFNGFKMFARYDQLKALESLGEETLQLTILNKITAVMNLYYDMAQQQQQLSAYDTILSISGSRVNIAQARFEIGKSSRLEVLNAQVDYNTDTTNLIRQQTLYANTRTQLNREMARDVSANFSVADSIDLDYALVLSDLTTKLATQNPNVQSALLRKRIAELELRQVRADRYPVIGLNARYNFTNSRSALGFATSSRGRGLEYGISASVNLFNGFNQRRLEKNAGIMVENAQLSLEQTQLDLQAQLASAYQSYTGNLALVDIEKNNLTLAARNLEITLDKFKLGSIATVEFRTAQVNFINATQRYTTAQYEAKLQEIFLKGISGDLGTGIIK